MKRSILITGGAGFIGSNLADRLISQGHEVVILDNLSRRGSRNNAAWLRQKHGPGAFRFHQASVAEDHAVGQAVAGVDVIFHLAGQVSVTESVKSPLGDLRDNVLGTVNLLEAARTKGEDPIFLYSSTNKVYGQLEDLAIERADTRYVLKDYPDGLPESLPLDLRTPYACSKGSGEFYVRDYWRTFGLRTVVMRQSCIYGPRQFGAEEQGWVAWFLIAAGKGDPITIYGDGRQVRDLLHVEDLLDAYAAAVENIDAVAGGVFNIGGGPANSLSVWSEFGGHVRELTGRSIDVAYAPARPGDQKVFICDISKARRLLGWSPRTSPGEGIAQTYRDWVLANLEML